MAQFFAIHPTDPQERLINQAADIVRGGGVIVYPTDSCYALGCLPGNKQAMERILRIRGIPDNRIALALLQNLNEPMLSCTLMLPHDDEPLTDPYDIRDQLEHEVDLVIDGGWCGTEPTTVIDMTEDITLIRQGKGDAALFGL